MSKHYKRSKLSAAIISLFVSAIIFAGSGARSIAAQEEMQTTAAVFGFVGVAFGQTAQLNVVNVHPPDPVTPVEIEIRIINRAGNILTRSRVRLGSGQSAKLQIDPRLFVPDGSRLELRALVMIKHPPEGFNPKLVVSTLEIISNDTGETSVFMDPASLVGFNPQPEPPAQ